MMIDEQHQCSFNYNSLLTPSKFAVYDIVFFVIAAIEEIRQKMTSVKHKILILSGKGGVGKSTFSAHLSHALASDDSKEVSSLICAWLH